MLGDFGIQRERYEKETWTAKVHNGERRGLLYRGKGDMMTWCELRLPFLPDVAKRCEVCEIDPFRDCDGGICYFHLSVALRLQHL